MNPGQKQCKGCGTYFPASILRDPKCELCKQIDQLKAQRDELLEAAKLMLEFWDDLSKSNPGFMGKLCLQDYARWNMALLKLPAAIVNCGGAQ